ncbi:MAG: twin-arginine translocase TatA/TatE family subunit [Commensalibacter sp.]|nr:twin-arginine translocase TatA/TatE family subunit [Commensalibacter sp.]
MGSMSIWHWLIVLVVILLVFGTGKITTLMGDVAKGIKVFKKNIAEDEPSNSDETKAQKPISPPQNQDNSVPFNETAPKDTFSSDVKK